MPLLAPLEAAGPKSREIEPPVQGGPTKTVQRRPHPMEKGQDMVNMRGPKAEDKANTEGWNATGLVSDCPYINLVTTYNFTAPPAGGAVLTHS